MAFSISYKPLLRPSITDTLCHILPLRTNILSSFYSFRKDLHDDFPVCVQIPVRPCIFKRLQIQAVGNTFGGVASSDSAKKILEEVYGTEVLAYVSKVHRVALPEDLIDHNTLTRDQIESNIVRCPDTKYAEKMIAVIDAVTVKGDSVGGVVTCIVRNCPRGLGLPLYDKLEIELAKAIMSLPATTGIEFGSGFAGTSLTGKEHNDDLYLYVDERDGKIRTRTNHSGGIRGGISNGKIINMSIAFKPTVTVGRKWNTWTRVARETGLAARGVYDPCILPRVVPMVEGLVALVLLSQLLTDFARRTLPDLDPPQVPF